MNHQQRSVSARNGEGAVLPHGQQWIVTAIAGGTGRTTVARGLAHLSSSLGDRTLLVGTERHQHGGWAEHCQAQLTGRQLAGVIHPGLDAVPAIPGTLVHPLAAASMIDPPLHPNHFKQLVAPVLSQAARVVIDAELGPVTELGDMTGAGSWEATVGGRPWWTNPSSMWVFVTATDPASMRRMNVCLDALAAAGLSPSRMVVVLNEHHGRLSVTARRLRATLQLRCALVVTLPSDRQLAAPDPTVQLFHHLTHAGLTSCLAAAAAGVTHPGRNP